MKESGGRNSERGRKRGGWRCGESEQLSERASERDSLTPHRPPPPFVASPAMATSSPRAAPAAASTSGPSNSAAAAAAAAGGCGWCGRRPARARGTGGTCWTWPGPSTGCGPRAVKRIFLARRPEDSGQVLVKSWWDGGQIVMAGDVLDMAWSRHRARPARGQSFSLFHWPVGRDSEGADFDRGQIWNRRWNDRGASAGPASSRWLIDGVSGEE
jgi:hypothetical protein